MSKQTHLFFMRITARTVLPIRQKQKLKVTFAHENHNKLPQNLRQKRHYTLFNFDRRFPYCANRIVAHNALFGPECSCRRSHATLENAFCAFINKKELKRTASLATVIYLDGRLGRDSFGVCVLDRLFSFR